VGLDEEALGRNVLAVGVDRSGLAFAEVEHPDFRDVPGSAPLVKVMPLHENPWGE
jgi:hypothetical protein